MYPDFFQENRRCSGQNTYYLRPDLKTSVKSATKSECWEKEEKTECERTVKIYKNNTLKLYEFT